MQFLYISLMAFVSTFFIFRRRVDLFLLWFVGLFAISPPYFFGYIYIPPLIRSPEGVANESYFVMVLNVLFVLVFAIVFDKTHRFRKLNYYSEAYLKRLSGFSFLLTFFSFFLFVIVVGFVGVDALSNHRSGSNLGAIESGLVSKAILFAMYSVLFGFFSRNILGTAIGFMVLVLMYLISPSRSFLFITFLSVLMVFFIPKGKVKFRYLLKFLPIFLFILSFVVLGKVFRHEGGNIFQVAQNYVNDVIAGDVIFREANYIAANLQVSIETLNAGEMVERFFYYPLMLIPFLYLVFVQLFDLPSLHRFSGIVADIHDFDRFGIASSLWGEFYSVGGWFSIVLFVFLFNAIVFGVNSKVYKGKMSAFSLVIFIPTIYIVAYSHRLDFALLLNRFSEALLIYILYLFYSKLRKL